MSALVCQVLVVSMLHPVIRIHLVVAVVGSCCDVVVAPVVAAVAVQIALTLV